MFHFGVSMFHFTILSKDNVKVTCGLRREAYGDGSAKTIFTVQPLIPRGEAIALGLTGEKMSVTAPQNADQYEQWNIILARLKSEGWN